MADEERRPWWRTWEGDLEDAVPLPPGCLLALLITVGLPLVLVYLAYRLTKWVLRRIGAEE
jgi:hypothetical protein